MELVQNRSRKFIVEAADDCSSLWGDEIKKYIKKNPVARYQILLAQDKIEMNEAERSIARKWLMGGNLKNNEWDVVIDIFRRETKPQP